MFQYRLSQNVGFPELYISSLLPIDFVHRSLYKLLLTSPSSTSSLEDGQPPQTGLLGWLTLCPAQNPLPSPAGWATPVHAPLQPHGEARGMGAAGTRPAPSPRGPEVASRQGPPATEEPEAQRESGRDQGSRGDPDGLFPTRQHVFLAPGPEPRPQQLSTK